MDYKYCENDMKMAELDTIWVQKSPIHRELGKVAK